MSKPELTRRVTVSCKNEYCDTLVETVVGVAASQGKYCEDCLREAVRLWNRLHDRKRRGGNYTPVSDKKHGGFPTAMTKSQVERVRELASEGVSYPDLASLFNISRSYVGTIVRGEGPIKFS